MNQAVYVKVIEYGEDAPALIQFYWAKSGVLIYEQMVNPLWLTGDWPQFADKRIMNLGIMGRRARLDIIKNPTIKETIEQKGESVKNERPVIVTTSYCGVFFGYATNTDGETIFLKRARLCIYWTADLRGFMGLATYGPGKQCKIGPAADITLRGITAVIEVTPAAVEKWEAEPWA